MIDETVRVPKLAELIADFLRVDIVNGRRAVGERLPAESVLTKMFDASRPSVREALRILEFEQLVVVRRGSLGGPEVMHPAPATAATRIQSLATVWDTDDHEAADLLAGAEIAAVRRLARWREVDAVEPLLSANGDADKFHQELLSCAGLKLSTTLAMALPPGRSRLRCTESTTHRTVLNAIRRGDTAGAVSRWRSHLDQMANENANEPKSSRTAKGA